MMMTSNRATVALIWIAATVVGAPCPAQTYEDQKVTAPSDWDFQDHFGITIGITDELLLVGEPNDDDPDRQLYTVGKAYLFKRVSSGWEHVQTLAASDPQNTALFGAGVALDRSILLAGAPRLDVIAPASGAAYVFEDMGTTWVETAKLAPADGKLGDWFGWAIALNDGRALIAAPLVDVHGPGSGAAYVFDSTPNGWVETTKLIPAQQPMGTTAGFSVALQGSTAVLGAPNNIGEAFVFERMPDGTWLETQQLSDPTPRQDDLFSYSLSLEGDILVVGEPASSPAASRVGSAFVFERIGGTFVLQAELQASNGEVYGSPGNKFGDAFGCSVAVHGGRIFVGASNNREAGDHVGSAYVFERNAAGKWIETERFLPRSVPVTGAGMSFGVSLAVSDDTLAVGALGGWAGDATSGAQAGAVYVFGRPMGEVYCDTSPSSAGPGATITATGSVLAQVGALTLTATDLPPGRFGVFLVSPLQGFTPNPGGSQGNLCLAAPIGRFAGQVESSGGAGVISIAVDTGQLPMNPPVAIRPGDTWNFQAWYRDKNPVPTSNLTDAVAVRFR